MHVQGKIKLIVLIKCHVQEYAQDNRLNQFYNSNTAVNQRLTHETLSR